MFFTNSDLQLLNFLNFEKPNYTTVTTTTLSFSNGHVLPRTALEFPSNDQIFVQLRNLMFDNSLPSSSSSSTFIAKIIKLDPINLNKSFIKNIDNTTTTLDQQIVEFTWLLEDSISMTNLNQHFNLNSISNWLLNLKDLTHTNWDSSTIINNLIKNSIASCLKDIYRKNNLLELSNMWDRYVRLPTIKYLFNFINSNLVLSDSCSETPLKLTLIIIIILKQLRFSLNLIDSNLLPYILKLKKIHYLNTILSTLIHKLSINDSKFVRNMNQLIEFFIFKIQLSLFFLSEDYNSIDILPSMTIQQKNTLFNHLDYFTVNLITQIHTLQSQFRIKNLFGLNLLFIKLFPNYFFHSIQDSNLNLTEFKKQLNLIGLKLSANLMEITPNLPHNPTKDALEQSQYDQFRHLVLKLFINFFFLDNKSDSTNYLTNLDSVYYQFLDSNKYFRNKCIFQLYFISIISLFNNNMLIFDKFFYLLKSTIKDNSFITYNFIKRLELLRKLSKNELDLDSDSKLNEYFAQFNDLNIILY
ncbi:hypothetical protein TBLA_0A07070 [Henningerozyma blattae CBS 6284]|uniref:Uncharacterized protein n=1 Tax=Henningerozyma blattae (strain ATCC 34711 / CBS 6284 / DSM 70876 / NBRC 10599 / NRRL Y-10934 / UCD 77-7) TaxID=1071380 RepID=I2GWJ6_HENB6|nr:hypothetical protein TBLA_0A07070 [Tetrapisispora blattae CBS 6284]CCH58498.1 hypothetical protein TBLA_0A07070 [Tetrapisispora blattae CBS 6284]